MPVCVDPLFCPSARREVGFKQEGSPEVFLHILPLPALPGQVSRGGSHNEGDDNNGPGWHVDAPAGQRGVAPAVGVVDDPGDVGAGIPVHQAQVALGDDVSLLPHVRACVQVHLAHGHTLLPPPAPLIPEG